MNERTQREREREMPTSAASSHTAEEVMDCVDNPVRETVHYC